MIQPGTTGSKLVPCHRCDGRGYVGGYATGWVECRLCDGTGDAYGRGNTQPEPRSAESKR